jgi:iron complex transport system substrate-binding protein
MRVLVLLLGLVLILSCSIEREEDTSPRYVVTSPEVGEIIYALQGSTNIVGVTAEVNYPVELASLPKVGEFGAVSREKIIALRPSIVFTSGLEQEMLARDLNKVGIKTVMIYPKSIPELLAGIREIAGHLEMQEKGIVLADSLQLQIEGLRYSGQQRPRVYLEIYGNPIMSISRNSFIGEIVELAGGDNIFDSLPRDYSRVRAEDIIDRDPEIIILTYPGLTPGEVKTRKGWQNITACLDDRIYGIEDIDPDIILRAGPRITEGISLLKRMFHEL